MIYVAFMTFVLIMSSVTMVLAVDAGHQMNKAKVTIYMFLLLLVVLFLWGLKHGNGQHLLQGDYGAFKQKVEIFFSLEIKN